MKDAPPVPHDLLYDIEMPPPAQPDWLGWLVLLLLAAFLLWLLLRWYRQRQPEHLALQELRVLQQHDPYQLAALLRRGLQHKQLARVLPDDYLARLDQARYAARPEVAMPALFAEGEQQIMAQYRKLDVLTLGARLVRQIRQLPFKRYWLLALKALRFVADDFIGWVKAWPSILRGRHD